MKQGNVWKNIGLGVLAILLFIIPGMLRIIRETVPWTQAETFSFFQTIQPTPGSWLVHTLSSFISLELVGWILPLFLGLVSFFLVWSLVDKLDLPTKYTTIIFLIISPFWIILFSQLHELSFFLTLILIGVRMYVSPKSYLAFLFFGLAAYIDVLGGAIATLSLLAYSFIKKDKIRSFYLVLVAVCIAGFLKIMQGKLLLSQLISDPLTRPLFAELGVVYGITIPLLILGGIGFVQSWKRQTAYSLWYVLVMVMAILSIYVLAIRILFLLVLVAYAAAAWSALMHRNWSYDLMKKVTLLLIVCSFLFSTVSFYSSVVRAEPTSETILVLEQLEQTYGDTYYVVLAPLKYRPLVLYFTALPTYLPPTYDPSLETQQKEQLVDTLLATRNFATMQNLLDESDIRLLLIDETMKSEQWFNGENGLYFLVKNSESFINIYQSQSLEIWEYVPS